MMLERQPPLATPVVELAARRYNAVPWLAAAALVQAVALGVVGTAMFHRPVSASQEPRYTTLSADASPAAGSEHIRAVFAPDLTLSALNELISRTALSIIGGPSDAGVYTPAFTDPHGTNGRLNQAIAALRANAQVKFAEPAVNDEVALR